MICSHTNVKLGNAEYEYRKRRNKKQKRSDARWAYGKPGPEDYSGVRICQENI